MSYLFVAVPVLKGRSTFVIDKGRAWSAIEHLLLEALSRRRWSSAELATAGKLPRRVVVEALTRLMRAGWVEVSQIDNKILFGATKRGVAAASSSELPAVIERTTKSISYVVDLIGGAVFRKRGLSLHTENEVLRDYGAKCIRIEPPSKESVLDPNEIINTLLDDDEAFVTTERSGTRYLYLLVTVREGLIEGLPDNKDLPHMRLAILEAARSSTSQNARNELQSFKLPRNLIRDLSDDTPHERPIRFRQEDLILDGPAHQAALISALNNSHSIVIIHSTFISSRHFFDVFNYIRDAANRGVRIHIMWGQNENPDEQVSTQTAISEILSNPEVRALGENLKVHPFSTGSHAKLLFADAGTKGHIGIVGSCNWLTSNFSSYEASIRLRDNEIIEDIIRKISALAPVRNGDWKDFSSELVHLRMKISKGPRCSNPNASASIIVGAQHNREVLKARDEALSHITVMSHRLGAVSSPAILVPLAAAVRERAITTSVYYGRLQKPVNHATGQEIKESAELEGIHIQCIEQPRIHAKIIAWDQDNVIVSSLNWLSADPVGFDNNKEIGICLRARGSADLLHANLKEAIDSA